MSLCPCQQEQVRQSSLQPLSVSCLGWAWRCSVCPQAPLRSAAGLHHQSASAAPQNKPGISMKGFSAQRKRENIKLFLVKGWGLLFVIVSLPFLFSVAVSLWKNWTVVFLWWVTESLSGSSFLFLICGLEFWKSMVYLRDKGGSQLVQTDQIALTLYFTSGFIWGVLVLGRWRQPASAFLTWNLTARSPVSMKRWKSFVSVEQSWLPLVLWSWSFSSL